MGFGLSSSGHQQVTHTHTRLLKHIPNIIPFWKLVTLHLSEVACVGLLWKLGGFGCSSRMRPLSVDTARVVALMLVWYGHLLRQVWSWTTSWMGTHMNMSSCFWSTISLISDSLLRNIVGIVAFSTFQCSGSQPLVCRRRWRQCRCVACSLDVSEDSPVLHASLKFPEIANLERQSSYALC